MLAALRRAGAPYELSPGRLLRAPLVTSGTLTNRVDRLVARGYVERNPDPAARRGELGQSLGQVGQFTGEPLVDAREFVDGVFVFVGLVR